MKETQAETKGFASLIQSLGVPSPIPAGLTVQNRIEHPQHGPLKVRTYATEAEASRIEGYLQLLAGKIAYPELLGRQGNHLVFRYLALEATNPAGGHQDTGFHLGRFLGILNTEPAPNTAAEELDQEFSDWLDRLAQLSLLPAFTTGPLKAHYRAHRPETLPVRFGYWDAMPHNFGWHQGDFTMLDEKHLRPSFPGVGLVKPSFLLPPGDWQRVRTGYTDVAPLTVYDRHRAFLEFYYLVAALYFYSLVHVAGRISLPDNLRFLQYRDRLIGVALGNNRWAALRGELDLYRSFPKHIPAFLARRWRGVVRRTRQLRV